MAMAFFISMDGDKTSIFSSFSFSPKEVPGCDTINTLAKYRSQTTFKLRISFSCAPKSHSLNPSITRLTSRPIAPAAWINAVPEGAPSNLASSLIIGESNLSKYLASSIMTVPPEIRKFFCDCVFRFNNSEEILSVWILHSTGTKRITSSA